MSFQPVTSTDEQRLLLGTKQAVSDANYSFKKHSKKKRINQGLKQGKNKEFHHHMPPFVIRVNLSASLNIILVRGLESLRNDFIRKQHDTKILLKKLNFHMIIP